MPHPVVTGNVNKYTDLSILISVLSSFCVHYVRTVICSASKNRDSQLISCNSCLKCWVIRHHLLSVDQWHSKTF